MITIEEIELTEKLVEAKEVKIFLSLSRKELDILRDIPPNVISEIRLQTVIAVFQWLKGSDTLALDRLWEPN